MRKLSGTALVVPLLSAPFRLGSLHKNDLLHDQPYKERCSALVDHNHVSYSPKTSTEEETSPGGGTHPSWMELHQCTRQSHRWTIQSPYDDAPPSMTSSSLDAPSCFPSASNFCLMTSSAFLPSTPYAASPLLWMLFIERLTSAKPLKLTLVQRILLLVFM